MLVPPVLAQTFIPVPDTSVSSVQHQHRYRTLRQDRYDINAGTGHFGKFGTMGILVLPVLVQDFIPVPDTSVSSVQHQHRYRTLREVRYSITTDIGHFGKFGTTSILVPVSSVRSVRHQYRYRTLRYVLCDINAGTGHFGKFGTTSITVLDIQVSSLHQYR